MCGTPFHKKNKLRRSLHEKTNSNIDISVINCMQSIVQQSLCWDINYCVINCYWSGNLEYCANYGIIPLIPVKRYKTLLSFWEGWQKPNRCAQLTSLQLKMQQSNSTVEQYSCLYSTSTSSQLESTIVTLELATSSAQPTRCIRELWFRYRPEHCILRKHGWPGCKWEEPNLSICKRD